MKEKNAAGTSTFCWRDVRRKVLDNPCEDPSSSFKLVQAWSATSETQSDPEKRGLFSKSLPVISHIASKIFSLVDRQPKDKTRDD
jgi:hypothetical protein